MSSPHAKRHAFETESTDEVLVPEDLEALQAASAPEPPEPDEVDTAELPVQGFLPPPQAPRGTSPLEERVRASGEVLLDTEEEQARGQALFETEAQDGTAAVSRGGERALLDWRVRSGTRRETWRQEEARRRATRERRVRLGTALVMLLLFATWAITEYQLEGPEAAVAATRDQGGQSPEELASMGSALMPAPHRVPEARPAARAEPSPVESTPAAEPVEATPPAPEPGPASVEATPAPEQPAVQPKDRSFTVDLVPDQFKTWQKDNHQWWQFDFYSADPIYLRWVDPDGEVALTGWTCDALVSSSVRRCLVRKNLTHLQPRPGDWSLFGCVDEQGSACTVVHRFTIEPS